MAMRCHSHLAERNIRAPIAPNAGEDVEQQELSLIAAGNGKGAATLEDSVAFSYKIVHTLTIHPATAFLGIY